MKNLTKIEKEDLKKIIKGKWRNEDFWDYDGNLVCKGFEWEEEMIVVKNGEKYFVYFYSGDEFEVNELNEVKELVEKYYEI